jgi:HlyD family secretion protein
MTQKSTAADIESDYQQAKMQADVDKQLSEEGVQAALTARKSAVVAEQLAIKKQLVQQQLNIADDAARAQTTAQEAHLEQQRVLYELKKRQLDALHVRAGLNGVLSAVSVEVGQQVTPGTNLVRVADPSHLKATVQIPETQAKDVAIGQKAIVDTHNGTAEGHVSRVDAAVVNGSVAVDVSFDSTVPHGARPDLSVDGTIEIERLPNVLYVGRPIQGQPNSTMGLFQVVNEGAEAVRVKVELGRTSVDSVEVLHGLKLGDQVILSDMSAWDSYDRIRLE